jgi:DNA segregation ATPase FtsK/SpoIIIE-like protein
MPLLARCDGRFDELFPQGLALVVRTNNFSISHLQRHLLLGYRRACRMMAAIEATGIVKRKITGD